MTDKRTIEKRIITLSLLSGRWVPYGENLREFEGVYRSRYGYVRIDGYDDGPTSVCMNYMVIHDGVEYTLRDPVARTRAGICQVASRFARNVVYGTYDDA